jgi:hypothetical protein
MTAAHRLAALHAVDFKGCSHLMGDGTAVRAHCRAQDVPDTLL